MLFPIKGGFIKTSPQMRLWFTSHWGSLEIGLRNPKAGAFIGDRIALEISQQN